jgi:hypothetical protein
MKATTPPNVPQINIGSMLVQPEPNSGCWIWLGPITEQGYGRVYIFRYKWSAMAHRVAFEQARGPIPDGMVIDHLCRTRICVNPDHMEAVTPVENVMRARFPNEILTGATHCSRGHELTDETTWLAPKTGRRFCRVCRRDSRSMKSVRARAMAARMTVLLPTMLEALRDVESKIVDFEAGRINWRPDDFLHRVRIAIAKAEERP